MPRYGEFSPDVGPAPASITRRRGASGPQPDLLRQQPDKRGLPAPQHAHRARPRRVCVGLCAAADVRG